MKGTRTGLLAVALVLLLAACGAGYGSSGEETAGQEVAADASPTPDDGYGTSPTAEAVPAPEPAPAGTWVSVADSSFGPILVDGEGRALYRFTQDARGQSNCTGDCEANWPVLRTDSVPQAGEGIDPALLGAAPRPDGTNQATIAEWPLYFFGGDGGPGETNGQGVGDVWYLVAPDGSLITAAGAGGY